jgi:hypothetical protein
MISHNVSEGYQPRNLTNRIGPRVSPSRSQKRCTRFGECISDVPGSKAMAGYSTVPSGTRESHVAPKRSLQQAEKARRRYGGMAVGPVNIRAVGGVMPTESPCSLEGAGSKAQRDE